MPIKEKGKWQLQETTSFRGSFSVITFPAGTILEITQVSDDKIIGPALPDWVNGYFINATKIKEE